MAIAIQTVSTEAFSNVNSTTTLTITKPTGLAVGDLMIAHLGFGQISGGGVVGSNFTRSGWLDLDGVAGSTTVLTDNETGLSVMYKRADSADVAASNFAFTNNGSPNLSTAGAIYRIDGQDSSPVRAYLTAGASNDSTPTFSTGITPSASCLIIILVVGYNASATSVDSVTITTSSPSFTEQYDQRDFAATVMAGYTGIRPESTSTGDWSASIVGGDGATDSVSAIIAIREVSFIPKVIIF